MAKKTAPLSQTQLGIYLDSQEACAYNGYFLLTLSDEIDMNRLARVIEKAVAAHPAIFVRVIERDGEPVQEFGAEDYQQPVEKMSEADWQKKLSELEAEPLELHGGRLFRFNLVQTECGKYLLRTTHHVSFDRTAANVFFSDVAKAYADPAAELAPENYDALDAANDETKARATETFAQAKSWYEKTFGGLDVETLPIPDCSGEKNSFATFTKIFPLDYPALKNFCRANKFSASALTSTAFALTVGTYTHQQEALFSTIYHGRSERTKNIVGMFVKTLPVYCRWTGDKKIAELLGEMTAQIQSARDNDLFSFADLNQICPMNNAPMFAYHGLIKTTAEFCGKPCVEKILEQNATGKPFAVELMVGADGMEIRIEYDAARYSGGFVETFAACYENVLRELMTKTFVREVELLNSDQIKTLDAFNATESDYDKTQTVVSLFAAAAEKFPNNTAVIFDAKKFSYREVDALSNDIAAYILGKNIGRGDVASILIPRSEFMPVTALGALKAGCAYQPLDPTYPPERLNFMIKDASAKILITTKELRPLITDFGGEVLFVDEIPRAENVALPEVKPEDIFILLYTSGSTGVPKGVRLTHKNLVCFINWYKKFFSLNESQCVGAYASFGFDANMFDTYPALTSGAALCIVPEEMRLDLEAMNVYFEKNRVTHAFMTTQVGRQFATDIENHGLKYLTVGGEKLVTLDPPKSFSLINGYGPTECTILITAFKVEKAESNIPIGKPLDNVKLYVVDANGHRVPIGACGELWAAGLHVGAGYLNRPEKTAEVFISNPFDGGEYETVYKTGDVVRWRADGNLEFIGRRDGQVKIRGFRIELTEVEAVIREFPSVKDATVAAFDHPAGGKFVAAYVVGAEKIDIDALNKFIAERKPPYMVPAVTLQIDKIPLNQNGKVNRRALPKPELQAAQTENVKRSFNVLEKSLIEVIGGVIGLKEFGATTELKYLGLASISAIKLSTQLYKTFGVNIPVKKLLGGTLETIEDELLIFLLSDKKSSAETSTAASSIKISNVQRGIYLECMKDPLSTAYNVPLIYNFEADADPAALADAVKKILAAHPSVDIHFELRDEEIMQVANKNPAPEIPIHTLEEKDFAAFKGNFVRPFKLDAEPLYRVEIVKTPARVSLFVDFHHLIFDGASTNLFLANLKTLLTGGTVEREGASYFDFVREEEQHFDANKKFFADLLKDFENASEIASDVHGRADGNAQIFEQEFPSVESFCHENGLTPAALCFAVLSYVVARYSANRKVYLTTISSGRGNVKFSDTFGMFVNTLPLAAELEDISVGAFLKKNADTFAATIEHENYPFAQIAADYSFAPKIMYEYQVGVVEAHDIPKFTGVESFPHSAAKFKLAVRIIGESSAPRLAIEYNTADYSANLIAGLANSFNIVLEKFTAQLNQPVRKVSLLDENLAQILAKFHSNTNPATVGKVYRYFHEGFEEQAAKNPDKIALIAADCSLTYGELDASANKIANALIERGVEPRNRIALLLPRTSREIIAMFGVLKAGCAFIPCDPEYPADRIRQILEDSAAPYVITTADRLDGEKFVDVENLLATGNSTKPQVEISSDDLAYLIYTSGSTGKPKGVMIAHSSAANFFTNNPANIMVDILVKSVKNFVSVSTFSFDLSLKELALPLFNGLTLVLADKEQANNPDMLADLILKTGGDAINATPSRVYQYLESDKFSAALKDFKFIGSGGEKYPEALLEKLRTLTKARIVNTYGPTETTISSNMKDLTEAASISVGRPLLNVVEFIVDGDGNELPPGIVGELLIGGAGVGKGYNNLPEKTAERFVEYNGVRVYKSGDYARWTATGDVEILARMDNQIKLRGLRIELGEVESTLAKVEGIKTVLVKIAKIKGIEHLCAYFTADRVIDVEALKKILGETLPKYMVPTAYLQLKKMPMTLNGKIDAKSLPEATISRSATTAKAGSKIEEDFCKIFGTILQIEDVGADESFFDLGGTSLLVTRVVIMAQKLGYKINFSDVFINRTPRELAALQQAGTTSTVDSEISGYDYAKLEPILSANNLDNFRNGERQPLGDIVLTGATGYLGIHILHEFIENHAGKIYCLLRGKKDLPAETRLKAQLFYYFDQSYAELFGKRIFILEGDVTRAETLEQLKSLPEISAVINCAALVKHFSSGDEIEVVNVGGVKNLVEVCKASNLRFIQVSTMSTVRSGVKGEVDESAVPTEKTLYFRQSLTNKYVRSKFLAERLVLDAVANDGLNAKIMRVGTLSARYSDGEFQINAGTNSSMGRLKIFAIIGCCPFAQMDNLIEFSPIDEAAKAILLLAETPKECVIFHPINHHNMAIGDVIRAMQKCGLDIKFVEQEEFQAAWQAAEEAPDKAKILTSSIAYRSGNKDAEVVTFPKNNLYTMQVLYRLGYSWPLTTWEYVGKFIDMLQKLGFFSAQ
ncbi:MAG: amino acid adenylation domain-containing protein [Selenomonadaceae bacterium]|nr:amino acid adenylation domain-containing protein [Selenomonadaceae bacterium]